MIEDSATTENETALDVVRCTVGIDVKHTREHYFLRCDLVGMHHGPHQVTVADSGCVRADEV